MIISSSFPSYAHTIPSTPMLALFSKLSPWHMTLSDSSPPRSSLNIRGPLRRGSPPRRRPARLEPQSRRGLQGHLLHTRRLRPGPLLHHGTQVCRRDPARQDTQHWGRAPADNVGYLGGVLPHHAGHGHHQLCAVCPCGDAVGGRRG